MAWLEVAKKDLDEGIHQVPLAKDITLASKLQWDRYLQSSTQLRSIWNMGVLRAVVSFEPALDRFVLLFQVPQGWFCVRPGAKDEVVFGIPETCLRLSGM